MIFNMTAGGGTSLNFKVVGNPQPENPSENTIWLNTDAEIAGWEIAPAAPEMAVEGMLWIEAGNSGEIVFNVLKKNSIQIFPLSAKQYVSGAWVDVEAQIYQGGEWKGWVDWDKWIVKNGRYKLPMVAEGKPYDPSYSNTTFTVTEADGGIRFNQSAGTGMVYWGLVDLTDATKLTIEGDFRGRNSKYPTDYMMAVWSNIGAYINNFTLRAQLTDTGATLNVSSLTGKYYVGFTVRDTGYEIVTNFYTE